MAHVVLGWEGLPVLGLLSSSTEHHDADQPLRCTELERKRCTNNEINKNM